MNHSLGDGYPPVNHGRRCTVDNFWAPLRDLLVPARCQFCDTPCATGSLCPACRDSLPWNTQACPRCARPQGHADTCAGCVERPPAFDLAFAALRWESPVREAIHQLKYEARLHQASAFGRLLGEAVLERGLPLPALLLPVPLHAGRLRRRGYNQALELARSVATITGQAICAGAARRIRATPDQIGMSAARRRRNLRGAFVAADRLRGQRVALLDDVMTTGATLGALAQACRRAGAIEVQAWALARVP
ncbi:MAG TPA: ComF family protein [Solimonas sp.]|nr:ComF family protein [Solimonas sp.]